MFENADLERGYKRGEWGSKRKFDCFPITSASSVCLWRVCVRLRLRQREIFFVCARYRKIEKERERVRESE